MIILQDLTRTQTETLKFFDLPAMDLQKSYGPGKWNIRQILVHLADVEGVLSERIKRTIAGPRQVIYAFDQDGWATNLDYKHFPLGLAKDLYLANRSVNAYLAEKYYETLGQKEYIHSDVGLRTLQDEFDKVVWHNEGHLKQIEMAFEYQ